MTHLAQSKCLAERPQCSLTILTIEVKTSYNITSRGQGFGSEVSIISRAKCPFLYGQNSDFTACCRYTHLNISQIIVRQEESV